jgi:hypothetical protein
VVTFLAISAAPLSLWLSIGFFALLAVIGALGVWKGFGI